MAFESCLMVDPPSVSSSVLTIFCSVFMMYLSASCYVFKSYPRSLPGDGARSFISVRRDSPEVFRQPAPAAGGLNLKEAISLVVMHVLFVVVESYIKTLQ